MKTMCQIRSAVPLPSPSVGSLHFDLEVRWRKAGVNLGHDFVPTCSCSVAFQYLDSRLSMGIAGRERLRAQQPVESSENWSSSRSAERISPKYPSPRIYVPFKSKYRYACALTTWSWQDQAFWSSFGVPAIQCWHGKSFLFLACMGHIGTIMLAL